MHREAAYVRFETQGSEAHQEQRQRNKGYKHLNRYFIQIWEKSKWVKMNFIRWNSDFLKQNFENFNCKLEMQFSMASFSLVPQLSFDILVSGDKCPALGEEEMENV